MKFSNIADEYDSKKIKLGDLGTACLCGDRKGYWYLAFRAAGLFQVEAGRLPGERNDDGSGDFDSLHKTANALIAELELDPDSLPDSFLKEMCRFGGSQIHTIAAYLGGVAAQEVIKFVTKQWEPFNNTFIYDGITGMSGPLEI